MEEKLDFDMFKEAYENVVKDIRILNVKDNETEISRLEKEIAENEAKIQEWNKDETNKKDRANFETYMEDYNIKIRDAEKEIKTLEETKEENKNLRERNKAEQNQKKDVLQNIRNNLQKQYEDKLAELKKEEEQLKEQLKNDKEYNDKKETLNMYKERKENSFLTAEEKVVYNKEIAALREMKLNQIKILKDKADEIKEFENKYNNLIEYFDELDTKLDEAIKPEDIQDEVEDEKAKSEDIQDEVKDEKAKSEDIQDEVKPKNVKAEEKSEGPKAEKVKFSNYDVKRIKLTSNSIKLELKNGETRDVDDVPDEILIDTLTYELEKRHGYKEEDIKHILTSPTVDKNILFALCDNEEQFLAYLQAIGYGDNGKDVEKLIPEIEYNLKDRNNTTFKERYELYKKATQTQETLEEYAGLGEKCKINARVLDKILFRGMKLLDNLKIFKGNNRNILEKGKEEQSPKVEKSEEEKRAEEEDMWKQFRESLQQPKNSNTKHEKQEEPKETIQPEDKFHVEDGEYVINADEDEIEQ